MDEADVPDETELLRLVWDPDDFVDGKIQPAAFKSDLKGDPARSLSVDRADRLIHQVIRCTATRQQTKARLKREQAGVSEEDAAKNSIDRRFCALGVGFSAGDARKVTVDYEGKTYHGPLRVSADRVEPGGPICPLENPAHCLVGNVSGQKSKGFVQALQTKLAAIFQGPPRPIDDILAEHGEVSLPRE